MLQPSKKPGKDMGTTQSHYPRKATAYDVAGDHYGDLEDMVVIITGASSGIGRELARVLSLKRATVILGCRNVEKGEKAVSEILKNSPMPNQLSLEVLELDLASFESIREFSQNFIRKELPLHVLINNAGIMAIPDYQETKDGFEMQWGVNYLGHFYLTLLLMERLIESSPSRVVNISSAEHEKSPLVHKIWLPPSPEQYGPWENYALSKLCLIMFANECHRRYKDEGVSFVSLNPGKVNTNLDQYNFSAKVIFAMSYIFAKSVSQGAATPMFCAIGRHLEGGCYYENCAKSTPSDEASDDLQARRLWDLSMRLTGLERGEYDESPLLEETDGKSEELDLGDSDHVYGSSAPLKVAHELNGPQSPTASVRPNAISDTESDTSAFRSVRTRGLSAPNWVPDKKSKNCLRCEKKFNFFNRRHHCRYCGRLVCSSCSSNHIRSIFYRGKTQRTCEDCVDDARSDAERYRGSIYMPDDSEL